MRHPSEFWLVYDLLSALRVPFSVAEAESERTKIVKLLPVAVPDIRSACPSESCAVPITEAPPADRIRDVPVVVMKSGQFATNRQVPTREGPFVDGGIDGSSA